MTSEEYCVKEKLRDWLSDSGKVVIAGVGNPIRTDDFVGVKIVQDLRRKLSDRVFLIECETVPESCLQQIVDFKPTHILLIDAALLGLKPGEVRLVDPERLVDLPAISTHMLPLRIFCDYARTMSGAKIGLLLIEPGITDFGEMLTDKVKTSASQLAFLLSELLS